MARYYTTTINLKCWKEHTCVSCGAVHSYEFIRTIKGTGGNPAKSQASAKKKVDKTLKTKVDLHPCPACGIYQPDMIGQKRRAWTGWVFFLALVAFAVMVILRLTDVLAANTATWIIVATGVLAALQLFGKELKNFNADPEANKALAAEQINTGKLRLSTGQPATAADEWVQMPRSAGQKISPILLLIGLILVASPELLRMQRHWPINAAAYPPVVGPSDTTRVYMHDKIQSLNGYWRGIPNVTLTDNASGQTYSLSARANNNDWGSTIDVDSNNERNSATPWVEVQMPDDKSLAGKTVDCNVVLNLEYPQKSGDKEFETVSGVMSEDTTLHLASPGAGTMYNQVWWFGGGAGVVVILATSLILNFSAARLQKRANPTRILNPAPAA